MSDISYAKKLIKYRGKLANSTNSDKNRVYLSKIQEYTKLVNINLQHGGEDEEDLINKVNALKKTIPNMKDANVSRKVEDIVGHSVRAKQEHDKLIAKFVEKIKTLNVERERALEGLQAEHNVNIKALTKKMELMETEKREVEEEIKRLIEKGSANAELQQQISSLKTSANTLREEIKELNTTKLKLQRDLDSLMAKYESYREVANKQIDSLTESINALSEQYEELKTQLTQELPKVETAEEAFERVMASLRI